MALTFLSPQFLYLLGALPLVVALHFLRSRRTPVDVSALFLWQRARQVVAKRRRFSPTWLLAAQLLFTALAAVALARPALVAANEPDRVLIIDTSASMASRARADENAGTRLAEALEQASGLIAGSGRLALIRAGSQATLLLPLEASAADRSAALTALAAGDASADISGALDLAAALLPGAEIHLFSDQRYELGQAEVHVVGETVANVGIGALDIGIGQVFVGVVSSESGPVETSVALYRDGEPVASGSVLVPANGTGTITFPLPDLSGIIEARLEPGTSDALALDDVAFAGSRSLLVVTDDSHGALTRALSAVPNTTVSYSIGARLLAADLKVLTRGAVGGDEPGNYLVVSPPLEEPNYQVVSDWERADPLLRFVDLSELVVGLAPAGPAWEPAPRWRVLARTSDLTPVMRVRDDDGVFELQFAFHPSQSDIALRPAFPALMANVVERLRTTRRVRLGEAPPGDLGDVVAAPAAQPVLVPGIYRLYEDGLQQVAESAAEAEARTEADSAAGATTAPVLLASLLSAGESRLPSSGDLVTGVAGAAGSAASAAAAAPEAALGADGADSSAALTDPESRQGAPDAVSGSDTGAVLAPGGAPTTLGIVLLVLAVLTMVLEWALYSGSLEALAGRLGVRPSATL